ncbi:MAG: hypothetical protein PVJ73_14145 [Acidobacteriota bacterium]|jgi:hypothetical protein
MVTERPSARWLGRVAQHRLAPLAVGLLAVLLSLPALGVGLIGDDYFHRMVLLGIPDGGFDSPPLRYLFSFVPEGRQQYMMDIGYLPWWCDPGIHIAFSRPLTALTHMADYALWPDRFGLQHLHSLAWLLAGVALVAVLYRRLHGATLTAAVAAALFALEDAHALPAGWLANRNALICLVAGTGVVLLHLAWHRRPSPWRLVLALLALGVALGCGEAAIGALAYVAAWQLTEQKGSWLRRLAPLVPYGLVVVAWRVIYVYEGYGTGGSTLYVDPGGRPLQFLAALVERWPVLLLGQWLQLPIDLYLILPRVAQLTLVWVGVIAIVLVAKLLWPLLRSERLARFWILGMGLSMIPVCAAFPMDRLLLFAGIGAFGALAMLLELVGVWPWGPARGGRWRRGAAWLLLIVHGPTSASLLVARTALMPLWGSTFSVGAKTGPAGPEVAEQTFVFVNGNDFPVVYTRVIRLVEGSAPAPRRVAQLAAIDTANTVEREGERTLVITSHGGFLSLDVDRLLASPERSFAVGEHINRPDYVAEIRSITSDRRPRVVAFRFRQPLEHRSLRWLYWKDTELIEFPLPAVGTKVVLEAIFPMD